MTDAERGERSDDRAAVWSGAPASPGSELTSTYALAVALAAVPLMIIGGLLLAVLPGPWWLGVLVGLVAAVGLVAWRAGRADAVVLAGLTPAVPVAGHPERLTNMVESLTLAGGVVPPEVVVLDDPARNAMAVRCQGRNHLVLTRGLLEALGVVELEGAVAELLTRLRNGDAEVATLGSALFGGTLLDGPLAPVLGPVADLAIDRLLPPDRDLMADLQAVSLTRYPPGLRNALGAMEAGDLRPAAATRGNGHLWLADPGEPAAAGSEHRAPLSLRIDALAEL